MARFNRPYDTSYFVVITRLSYTSDILPLSWCTTYMRACELEKSFSFDKHLAIKATDDFRLIYTHILVVIFPRWIKMASNSQSDLQRQGHWHLCRSIAHMWFPISLPLYRFRNISIYLRKFNEIMWTWIHPKLRKFIIHRPPCSLMAY